MKSTKKNKRKLKQKLFHKYRLVVLNDDSFEERVSFRFSKFYMALFTIFSVLILVAGTALLIAFTPLKEYIPGYSSTALKNKSTRLSLTVDSLSSVIDRNEVYFQSIRNVLSGNIDTLYIDKVKSTKEKNQEETDSVNLLASPQDSILRAKVEQEDKYNLLERASFNPNFTLFPPVFGQISDAYDPEKKHFAVDIVTEKDEPVKATLDGTVIFAEWTVETGYVIILEHNFGLISVYKHNDSLLKSQGDLVIAGEVIATVGNTGEYSYGTHLHFELWVDGYPVNPSEYITFE